MTPGYKRVRRPDDDVEPEVRWYEDGDQQLALLRAVLTELREEGFAGPRTVVLSPSATSTAPPPGSPSSPGTTASRRWSASRARRGKRRT